MARNKFRFTLNPFEIMDDIVRELNPFQVLIGAVEDSKDNYRVDIDMRYVNELVQLEVLEESENLLDLDIFALDGSLFVKGEYHIGDYPFAGFLNLHEVIFNAEFVPIWVKSNNVRFRLVDFSLKNKEKKKFDIVKLISRLFPYHKVYIMREIVSLYPALLAMTRLKNEIKFNLNYFLEKANLNQNAVKIHKVELEPNKLKFFVKSNVVLKSLVDVFGSRVISVHTVSGDGSEKIISDRRRY